MTEKEIADIIYKELYCVYCYNCRYDSEIDNEDACELCHRKNNRWGISMGTAQCMAKEIKELIE